MAFAEINGSARTLNSGLSKLPLKSTSAKAKQNILGWLRSLLVLKSNRTADSNVLERCA